MDHPHHKPDPDAPNFSFSAPSKIQPQQAQQGQQGSSKIIASEAFADDDDIIASAVPIPPPMLPPQDYEKDTSEGSGGLVDAVKVYDGENKRQSLNSVGGSTPMAASSAAAVNVNFSQQQVKPRSRILGMSRPMFAGVSVLAMGAAGLGMYTGIRIPELNSQVDDLEEQVDRLEKQVTLLKIENARFNISNNILNASIHKFQEENEQLNETSISLRMSVDTLNTTIDVLEDEIVDLQNITEQIGDETDRLNATNQKLEEDVDALEKSIESLEERNDELQLQVDNLESSVADFEELNNGLNETYQDLVEVEQRLQNTQQDLEQNINDLSNITTWMNETVQGTNAQIAATSAFVSNEVATNRILGIERLHLNGLDARHGWDCGMAKLFPNEFQNPNVPIDNDAPDFVLNEMLQYQTNTSVGLIPNLCLNETDYQAYLNDEYDLITPAITTNELVIGSNTYSDAALDYMFPNDCCNASLGMTHEQWEAAQYKCENIVQFRWTY